MESHDYFLAGYNNIVLEAGVKPIWSSTMWFAYECGILCKDKNIMPKSFKMSRGYTCVINNEYLVSSGN